MEGLGGQKLSELLMAMDKLKPKDPNSFYAYHFLQRMPREVCILLAHNDLQDMIALAEKADQLMALHQPQSHDGGGAARGAGSGQRLRGGSKRQGRIEAAQVAQRQQGKQRDNSPSQSIVEQSPLCWAYILYGDKAYSCTKPCVWLEN
jgi:hypothetical protein